MSEINTINVNGTSYDIADNSAQELLSDLVIIKRVHTSKSISGNSYAYYDFRFDYDDRDSDIYGYIVAGVSGFILNVYGEAQYKSVFITSIDISNFEETETDTGQVSVNVLNTTDIDITSVGLTLYVIFIKKDCCKYSIEED